LHVLCQDWLGPQLTSYKPLMYQVHSSAKGLRLVTFDADGTLYADGCHMEHDNEMVSNAYVSMLAWWVIDHQSAYSKCIHCGRCFLVKSRSLNQALSGQYS
jgi:hypothetical protein